MFKRCYDFVYSYLAPCQSIQPYRTLTQPLSQEVLLFGCVSKELGEPLCLPVEEHTGL